MFDLTKNGFVIQKVKKLNYQGIDGENWFLNSIDTNNYFESYFEENIENAWCNRQWVDCCTDLRYIKKYIEMSNREGISFRIILCETLKKQPVLENIPMMKVKFLGYDYAYSGGDYYSCIYNELVGKRLIEFEDIELNENGLLSTEKELLNYLSKRKMVKEKYHEMLLEEGDFTIYRLSEILNWSNVFCY